MIENKMTSKGLRTPRAAAIAGIIFALLLSASIVLIKLSMASNPAEAGKWLVEGDRRTAAIIGANLVPFAGIAFLWFIGVMRDRLGAREDRFFATVFLGSGLLFVVMIFASAGIAIGMLASFSTAPAGTAENEIWTLGRNLTFALMNVFAMRMAAVFIISTSTIALRTSFIRRWLAFLGLAIALVLLISSDFVAYASLLFPFWIFLVSVDVLISSLREGRGPSAAPRGS
jgi:hypothetical protein